MTILILADDLDPSADAMVLEGRFPGGGSGVFERDRGPGSALRWVRAGLVPLVRRDARGAGGGAGGDSAGGRGGGWSVMGTILTGYGDAAYDHERYAAPYDLEPDGDWFGTPGLC